MDKSVGLDEETFAELYKIAERNNRTLVGQIRFWIKENKK